MIPIFIPKEHTAFGFCEIMIVTNRIVIRNAKRGICYKPLHVVTIVPQCGYSQKKFLIGSAITPSFLGDSIYTIYHPIEIPIRRNDSSLFFSIKYSHILRPVDRPQSCIGQYTMKFSTGPARLHCRQSHFTFCLISSSFPLFLFIALLFDRLMLSKTYTFCIQN
ncbi:hypothetical protein CQW35_03821 [Bacteroides fragilis]|nr:hypothetical protein CQW35_03821 [Bacteroides fragilis]